jgi:catechol 2,3-dioxygenase-like lactoylglutathione lyase family enzyme
MGCGAAIGVVEFFPSRLQDSGLIKSRGLSISQSIVKMAKDANMLASGKLVGFVLTTDYDKARAFYEGKLGLAFVSLDQYALVMSVGGHQIRIAKMPTVTPVQATVLGWEVDDIVPVVTWLRDRGVVLEKYPFAQDKEFGVWTTPGGDRVAWFKDPDGNILSVSQHTKR